MPRSSPAVRRREAEGNQQNRWRTAPVGDKSLRVNIATPATRAWYLRSDELVEKANRYMSGLHALPKSARHHAHIRAFSDFSIYRMIFESNLIERVGVATDSETRKVVEREFPKLPETYHIFLTKQPDPDRHLLRYFSEDELNRAIGVANALRAAGRDIRPSISFGNKSRPIMEVLRHYLGFRTIALHAYEFKLARAVLALDLMFNSQPKARLLMPGDYAEHVADMDRLGLRSGDRPHLITEASIKEIHKDVTDGLLPNDCGVRAGEYRNDVRSAGWEHLYPAPELVPDMMRIYIERARSIMHDGSNPIARAAWISYEFVRIHPFPDGNGRVSRLLMVMSLFADGLPFAVTIRGNAKGKHRYLTALNRAPRDQLKAMVALVALSVVEAFELMDKDLMDAGLPSILSFAEDEAR